MNFEFVGFVIGLIGAIWMKASMNLLTQEREKREIAGLPPQQESPALRAFMRGLLLILIGLGLETFVRLFFS